VILRQSQTPGQSMSAADFEALTRDQHYVLAVPCPARLPAEDLNKTIHISRASSNTHSKLSALHNTHSVLTVGGSKPWSCYLPFADRSLPK